MAKVTLPKLNQTGANEWADVEDNDLALREGVNSIAGEQLASATVGDEKLASPNNVVFRELYSESGGLGLDTAAATYVLGTQRNTQTVMEVTKGALYAQVEGKAGKLPTVFRFVPGDYAVAGLTAKFRVRAQVLTNATAPAIKFTIGLYPLTIAGVEDVLKPTLGTVVASSTVEINAPSASAVTAGASSEFTAPAEGTYVFGCVTSETIANNSFALVSAQLQVHNV